MRLFFVLPVVSLLLIISCPASSSAIDDSTMLAAAVNSFSLDLFNQISRDKGRENVFVSPFSVSTVLSILLVGAEGRTADQLIRSLHLDVIDANGKENGLRLMSEAIHNKSRDASLSLANYLLVARQPNDSQNTVLKNYESKIESQFEGKIEDVDFTSNGLAIKERVNSWVNDKTHGLIHQILSEPPSPDTILLLLNAIYFKGKWDEEFDRRDTVNDTFLNYGSNEIQTEFMQQKWSVKYVEYTTLASQNVKAVELPYQNDSYSMTIIVPQEKDGLKDLLSSNEVNRETTSILAGVTHAYKSKVDVKIPKFKLEQSYDLKPILQSMGVSEIFEGGDLSGIDGTHSIQVSGIRHKAVVRVDEEGTEAAAVTVVEAVRASAVRWPTLEFAADRPFLFLIRDTANGMILFIGKVEDL